MTGNSTVLYRKLSAVQRSYIREHISETAISKTKKQKNCSQKKKNNKYLLIRYISINLETAHDKIANRKYA